MLSFQMTDDALEASIHASADGRTMFKVVCSIWQTAGTPRPSNDHAFHDEPFIKKIGTGRFQRRVPLSCRAPPIKAAGCALLFQDITTCRFLHARMVRDKAIIRKSSGVRLA